MRRARWMAAGALTSAIVAVGCAREAKIDEAKLGRLPMEEKQAVFTAQHNVSVAEANRSAAIQAEDQSSKFLDVAQSELDAGKDRADAARKELDLARKANDQRAMTVAERKGDLTAKEVIAAKAKRDYATRLDDLRKNEAALVELRLESARAELEYIQADALRRNGIEPGVNMEDLKNNRDQVERKVADQERKVAQLRDEVSGLRSAWDQRRRAFNLALRETTVLPPTHAPAPSESIEPAPLPQPDPAAPELPLGPGM